MAGQMVALKVVKMVGTMAVMWVAYWVEKMAGKRAEL
jgi:hypothetical protein